MMKKPFIVGIAGGSASGKTTFSNLLEETLTNKGMTVKIMHMDEYFKSKNRRPKSKGPVTGVTYVDDNHPDTMELGALAENLRAEAASNPDSLDVILVEGLLTLWHKETLEQLDLKLFVDCQADERIVRRLRRNMRDRGLSFDEISSVYLDLVRYRHSEYVEPTRWRADFVLNGSSPSDKVLDMVSGWIENKVKADGNK